MGQCKTLCSSTETETNSIFHTVALLYFRFQVSGSLQNETFQRWSIPFHCGEKNAFWITIIKNAYEKNLEHNGDTPRTHSINQAGRALQRHWVLLRDADSFLKPVSYSFHVSTACLINESSMKDRFTFTSSIRRQNVLFIQGRKKKENQWTEELQPLLTTLKKGHIVVNV